MEVTGLRKVYPNQMAKTVFFVLKPGNYLQGFDSVGLSNALNKIVKHNKLMTPQLWQRARQSNDWYVLCCAP